MSKQTCQIAKVSQGNCRRIATVSRTTKSGNIVHLCAKCDGWKVGGTNKTAGEIIES